MSSKSKPAAAKPAARSASAGRFADVVKFLASVEDPKEQKQNKRRRPSKAEIDKLRRKFPAVPEEFLDYLREVGAGSFRECQFKVYGDLATPSQWIGIEDPKEQFLAFGDDFSETMSGFLPDSNWTIAEINYNSGKPYRIRQSFGKYIRRCMLMGPKGRDLRG